jgi:hypothetical protein
MTTWNEIEAKTEERLRCWKTTNQDSRIKSMSTGKQSEGFL